MNKLYKLILLLIVNIIIAQSEIFPKEVSSSISPTFKVSRERFISDNSGNILMYVNVWGHVTNPGHHLVYDGIDLATLISIVGGPLPGAKLTKVKLFRELPDEDGKVYFEINVSEFYKKGDRTGFIKIKPNDTLVFEPTFLGVILTQAGLLNTFLQILNISIQIFLL